MPTARSRIVSGSCWPCRKRRLKCDLLEPRCTKCERDGQQCQYGPQAPVKWVGGVALRGRLAPARASQSQALALPMSPSTPSPDDTSFLLYFANFLIPRFQLSDASLEVDLKAVSNDQSLQGTILAVSQAHYHLNSHVPVSRTALVRQQTRVMAIEQFRKRLELGIDSDRTARQLFVINILFCMLDGIIEPEQGSASLLHLKGGFALLSRWKSMTKTMLAENGLQAHLLSVFATMDLVHALLGGAKPFLEPMIWYMFAEVDAWWGRLSRGDRFLGLLKYFAELANVGHLVHSRSSEPGNGQLVERCLPAVDPKTYVMAPGTAGPLGLVDTSGQPPNWETFCLLYELSATIYFHRALQQRPVDDALVQEATQRAVGKLTDNSLSGMLAHCVILPILIIGAHCIDPDARQSVLRVLSPSTSFLSFGSLQVMTDFLRKTWNESDVNLSWWSVFESISQRVFIF